MEHRNAYQVKMDNVHDLEGDAAPRRMNCFADAKKACISAATDLYGADSQEVKTVTAAWGAGGVQ